MNGKESAASGTIEEPPQRLAYRLPEAGQLLGGITRKTVAKLIATGELETTQIGAYRYVTRESIEALIERGKDKRDEAAAA